MCKYPNIRGFLQAQRGSSLIEVLVTMLIFAIGLLGFAALQNRAQRTELEAYQRVEAINLIDWIAAQVRSNREAAGCYGLVGTTYVGTGYTGTYSCSDYGTAVTQAQVADDVNAWDDMLKGVSESLDGVNTGGLINARGCIEYDGVDTIDITLVWQGVVETTSLEGLTTCAESEFGDFANNYTLRYMTYSILIADFES